jgi:hypothetical protein
VTKYDTTAEALQKLTAPRDLAAVAYLFWGDATVLRIVRDNERFQLITDDGGELVVGRSFDTVAELEALIPPIDYEKTEGYLAARDRLVKQFIGATAISDTRTTSVAAKKCPGCGADWSADDFSRVVVSSRDGEAQDVACGTCLRRFPTR